MVTEQFLREEGYTHVRQMNNGEWVGCLKYLFTVGMFVGLNELGYKRRYCYENMKEAIVDLLTYEGEGDPKGQWIKVKGDGVDRIGPGAKGENNE